MRCKWRTAFQDDVSIDNANAISVKEKCVDVVSQSPWSTYDYGVSNLAAVQAEYTGDDAIWIGKTSWVVRNWSKYDCFNQGALKWRWYKCWCFYR